MDDTSAQTQRPPGPEVRLQVRLLGEVRVEHDGVPLPLSGAKRMAVLAFLALCAPHVVSRSVLLTAVWGENAPESADNAIQVHISALRGLLGRSAIVTSGDGYRLGAHVAVDVREYELVVGQGTDQLARGDAAGASSTLRRALAMWTGPALHGLRDAAFAESERARLESSRLVALEHRIEADMQLGRHHDVEPELEALVMANPLREQLRALLMDCLYRCGRQAEALAVFDAGRVILRDELGIDPSPTLREAHSRVLAQVSWQSEPEPGQSAPVPRQPDPPPNVLTPTDVGSEWGGRPALPLLADRTIGREREISAVLEMLADPDVRLLTLVGPGGVGKTRLAVEVARRAEAGYADGVVFVPMAQAEKPEDVATVVCQALAVPAGEDSWKTLLVALRTRRTLLICDNFEHVLNAADDLPELLSTAPGVTILVTSRQALRLRVERRYKVEPLTLTCSHDTSPAIELFLTRARASEPDFEPTAAELVDITAICERCDGLPLAVELAAAHVGGLSPRELREQLATSGRLLSGVERDYPERQQSLRASIAWSISALSASDAEFLLALTVFRGGFTLSAAAAVAEVDSGTALRRVESLMDNSLVQRSRMPDATTRFTMLETIREYAAELLTGEDAEALSRRHAVYYRRFMDPPDYPVALPRLARDWHPWMAERPNLRQAVRWATDSGENQLQADLVVGLFAMWRANGPRSELEQWLEAATEGHATSSGRRADAAYLLAMVRSLHSGPSASAPMLATARRLAERLADRRRLFFCTCSSAVMLAGAGRVEEAFDELAQARSLSGGEDEPMFTVLLDDVTGMIRDSAGDPIGAAEAYERALDVARPEGMLRTLFLLNNLSGAYLMTAPRRALDAAEEGLALASSMGVRESIADLTGQRGFARFLLGEHASGAADLAWAIDDHLAQGAVANALGFVPRFAAALVPDHPERAAEVLGVYHACVTDDALRTSVGTLVPVEHLVGLPERLGDAYDRHVDEGQELVSRRGKTEALRQLCASAQPQTAAGTESTAGAPPDRHPARTTVAG